MNRFICCLLFWCIYYPAQAQDIAYRQLREGRESPLVEVYGRIVQDSSGFIWAGGERGLFRFDGSEWKSYPHETAIRDVECLNLKLSEDQQLWYLNASGQICHLATDGNLIRAPLEAGGWILTNSNSIALDGDRLHFSISNEETKSKSYFSLIPDQCSDSGYKVDSLLENNQTGYLGSLAMDSLGQLYYLKFVEGNQKVEFRKRYENRDTLLESFYGQSSFSTFLSQPYLGDNRLFVFKTRSAKHVYYWKNDEMLSFSLWNSDDYIDAYDVFSDRSGNYWFATDRGVYGYDSLLSPLDDNGALASDYVVHNLLQDRDGAYWMGTKRNGILFAPNINARRFLTSNSLLRSDPINLLTPGPEGMFLAAGPDRNVYLFKDEEIIDIIHLGDFGYNNHFNYLNCEDGYIDIGGSNIGNFKLRIIEGELELLSVQSHTSGALDFYRDSISQHIFVGFNEGIAFYDTKKNFFHKKRSRILYPDKFKDKLWVGSCYGLGEVDLRGEEPRELNVLPLSLFVTDIAQTNDSLIWIGTSGQGVYSIDEHQVVCQYTQEKGLSSNNCRKLFVDAYDNVWVASDEGVSRINTTNDRITVVGEQHGLLDEIVHCLYIDSTYLWAGTDGGLYQIPLAEIDRRYPPLPQPDINSFKVNGEERSLENKLTLDYKDRNVVIDFYCLSFLDQQKLRYNYRLLGLDTSWLTVGATTTSVNYPSLNPGNYTFELTANRTDTRISSSLKSFSFEILKPIWGRTWFFGLLLLGIVVATAMLSGYIRRLRYERLLKHQSYEQRISNLRTKALRLQMNPHFVYNTMNAVFLAQMDRERGSALRIINRYGQLFRSVFEHAERDTIDLREEIDFLTIYLEMEELRFGDRINVQFKAPEALKISNAQIPPMLIQPLIENAFKHGLFHKDGEGTLEVSIRLDADVLTVEVLDDGVGRKYAQKMSARKRADRSVSSETILRERIALINQKVIFNNSKKIHFEVKDLLSIDGAPTGTLAQLKIPLN